jgi:hypothetical protein
MFSSMTSQTELHAEFSTRTFFANAAYALPISKPCSALTPPSGTAAVTRAVPSPYESLPGTDRDIARLLTELHHSFPVAA